MIDIILDFLNRIGIDPLYFFTVTSIAISISYFKDFKRWDKIPVDHKLLVILTLLGTIGIIIASILHYFGYV